MLFLQQEALQAALTLAEVRNRHWETRSPGPGLGEQSLHGQSAHHIDTEFPGKNQIALKMFKLIKYYWEIRFCVSIHGFSRITNCSVPIYIYILYIYIKICVYICVFICARYICTRPRTKHLGNWNHWHQLLGMEKAPCWNGNWRCLLPCWIYGSNH